VYANDVTVCISGQNDVTALETKALGNMRWLPQLELTGRKVRGLSLAGGETPDLRNIQEN